MIKSARIGILQDANMTDLDDKAKIAEIDKSNAYSSVVSLARQCRQAWEETQKLNLPQDYKDVKNIVLCGMGGSAYAALIIKSLFSNKLKIPFELVNGYELPAYVNEDTLILLSSYSGSTEEILSCAKFALEKKAKITAVANGSSLGEFVKTHSLPAYIFDAKFNPAGQPRLGQGYMIFGHMGILAKLGLIPLSDTDVLSAIKFLEDVNLEIEKLAKKHAKEFIEKVLVVVASEHLSGNAHVLRNQTNETAKNFAAYSLLPELNHHLMEGLNHPKERILKFLFLKSSLYSSSVQKRLSLTIDVVNKNKIEILELMIEGNSQLQQMLYALSYGGYLTFYWAILYGQDPSLIPWVDYFKEQLSKK